MARPRAGSPCSRSSSLWLAIFTCVIIGVTLLWPHASYPRARASQLGTGSDTLVVYLYRQIDAQAAENLAFFLRRVGRPGDEARYVIALDPRLGEKETQLLPELPPTASYYRPTSACFELGTLGEVLFDSGLVSHARFRYFVWADSTARGPFMPSYVKEPWHTHLTAPLSATLKLFGGTISCAGLKTGDARGWLQTPHVQGHVMATDLQGLKLLRSAGVFTCHQDWAANLRQGEREASATLLGKGFNIGCLMARYQGLDWREPSKWGCNAMIDPLLDGRYDGSTLQPYEVMFVPVQQALLTMESHPARQAVALDRWEHANYSRPGSDLVKANAWKSSRPGALQRLNARGIACFDAEFYIHGSPTEFEGFTAERAWAHFLEFGFHEGRVHRMVC